MPRKAKEARLFLRKRKGRDPVYVILDHGNERSTGFGPNSREQAEKALADYISSKYQPFETHHSNNPLISDILSVYAVEHAPTTAAPQTIGYSISGLLKFWNDKSVNDISAKNCRAYAKKRDVSNGTIRRELGVLNAAIQYAKREGYISQTPAITMPPKDPPTDRWLTRSEVAKLILSARRSGNSKHVIRFILIAVYTGTRKSAILKLQWQPSKSAGHIDLDKGLIYRSGSDERITNKRKSPAKIPRQLLLLLRLWRKTSPRYVIDYNGQQVKDIKTAWDRICTDAKIEEATRHTLKHTAITWAMQNGAQIADAASYFSTSISTIQDVYFHHHPDYQKSAVSALERKPKN